MFYSSPEDGTAMDTDSDEPQSTPLSHQCVLDTLNAVCTQDSVVREVIPRLVEHSKHLCHGKRSDSFVRGAIYYSPSRRDLVGRY